MTCSPFARACDRTSVSLSALVYGREHHSLAWKSAITIIWSISPKRSHNYRNILYQTYDERGGPPLHVCSIKETPAYKPPHTLCLVFIFYFTVTLLRASLFFSTHTDHNRQVLTTSLLQTQTLFDWKCVMPRDVCAMLGARVRLWSGVLIRLSSRGLCCKVGHDLMGLIPIFIDVLNIPTIYVRLKGV
jgi:hypothetical protein